LELSRTAKRVVAPGTADTEPARLGSTGDQLRRWAREWLYRPDAQVGWYPFAISAARRLLRERRFDAIFSSSVPVTAHLVARRLHHDFGVPWIAEFRDPWADAPSDASPRRRRWNRQAEDRILRAATAVVAVSPSWAELVRPRARRVEIVTNGFDPQDLPVVRPHPGDAITYLGTYYPDRQDLSTVFRALRELACEGHESCARVRVVGDGSAQITDLAREHGVALDVTGFLPQREALRHVAAARVLVLAGPTATDPRDLVSQGHIPAKLFEYLASLRPIVAVASPCSDVARSIRPFPGVRVVPPGDVGAAKAAFLSLLGLEGVDRVPLLEPYTRRSLTGRLARLFEDLASP
jgi:hypothetical protein